MASAAEELYRGNTVRLASLAREAATVALIEAAKEGQSKEVARLLQDEGLSLSLSNSL
jgi:hypothetical protein